jgi:ionotropic kainate glutamate receptor 4
MWNKMSNNPNVFVNSVEEGIEKVKSGGYAFFLESSTNEFLRERDCELTQIGGLLDFKAYGNQLKKISA